MPAADELYLLYQQCQDLTSNTLTKWEEHFQWLQDVVFTAKQAKSDAFIPKTPHKKKTKGRKKDDDENRDPIPPPPDAEIAVKRSSRAVAKAAQEKNKKALSEISNLKFKMRRPSTPKKEDSSLAIIPVQELECISVCDDGNEKDTCNTSVSDTNIPTSSPSQSQECSSISISETQSNENSPVKEIISESKVPANDPDLHIFKEPLPSLIKSPPPKEVVTDLAPSQKEESSRPVRSTRTKRRIAEEQEPKEEPPTRTTRTKKRKMQEEMEAAATTSGLDCTGKGVEESLHLHLTGSESETHCGSDKEVHSGVEPKVETIAPRESPQRITRSKVRKIVQKDSQQTIALNALNQNKIGIQNQKELIQSPKKYIGSPHKTANQKKKYGNFQATSEVEEVSVESINVQSSGKVVKHKRTESAKPANSGFQGSKSSFYTPPPSSGPTKQICSIRGIFNSGNFRPALSQNRGPLHKSSPQVASAAKVIGGGTPSEGRRIQNIMTGPSFVTRVQPSKPTKEESDERKREELRKRREREEETCRKKEELLRFRKEEQKRKNEERMKRVQELREAKAAEEREKREYQERAKEERKRNKKNEEARQLMLKRQAEEEQRQREEQKRIEERKAREERIEEEKRAREELKRIEEERRAREELKRIEEERKVREEQKRIIEEKRAKEELRRREEAKAKMEEEQRRIMEEKRQAKEKAREMERIAKEKEELERCNAKEREREAADKKLNETYTTDSTAMNATYTKPSDKAKQSYEMTPAPKEIKKQKKVNPNDYGIADLQSDDSTDEDCAPKKEVPLWARGSQLRKQLFDQEHYPPNIDAIFPPQVLLQMPDLCRIFQRRRSRFKKRTSSAVWNTPPYRVLAPNR